MSLDSNRKRSIISFWLFGLCNNFGYVIMLSAATDLISGDSKDSSYCSSLSTGAILLADVLPSFMIKLIAPLFVHKLHYNVKVVLCCVLSAASFLIVASSHNFSLSLFGVVIAAISSGFGEITFLAMSSHFEKAVITSWSSGTGFAGILGSLLYLALRLALNATATIYLMLIIPVLELITYWVILVRPATLNEPEGGFKPLLDNGDNEDQENQEEVTTVVSATLSPFRKLIKNIRELWYYIVCLFFVYVSEYLINQGMFEIMCFENISWSAGVQYRVYQVLYQVGVTISRSSASFVHFRNIHMFAVLQFINLVFFALETRYSFVPSIWIMLALILWEGLLGGACYVNAFYRIYNEVPQNNREYALGLVSVSDSMGITLAGLIAIPLHNFICQYRDHSDTAVICKVATVSLFTNDTSLAYPGYY